MFDFRYSFSTFEFYALLVFIPVLVLFLSNVPFVQRIPLETAWLMMADKNETATAELNAAELQKI